MKEDEERLRASWSHFCERLKEIGEAAIDRASTFNEADRMTALRQVARNISLSFQFELENADPLFPELIHYFDPLRKQGGDNPDALYLGAPINGCDHYRISGHIGGADYLAITAVERGGTPFGGAVGGTLFGDDLVVEDDGSFVINIGPQPCGSNWLRTTPDCYRVTIRQFFSDWAQEAPMRALIERVGNGDARPLQSSHEYADGLTRSADWLETSISYWAAMLSRWKDRPETFLAYSELVSGRVDATPGGEPVIAYWTLNPAEALVIRFACPDARYWSVELGNAWWESMDYRDRLCSTNSRHAMLEEDGSVLIVISHTDPNVPNWLDASGHSEGYVTLRLVGAANAPRPSICKVVHANLPDAISGARVISSEWRAKQIRDRRVGLSLRGAT